MKIFKYIPEYSNVCHVVFSETLQKMKCETCKIAARKGIPSACMVVVIGKERVSAQMFHPMYYKAMNSTLYETDPKQIK